MRGDGRPTANAKRHKGGRGNRLTFVIKGGKRGGELLFDLGWGEKKEAASGEEEKKKEGGYENPCRLPMDVPRKKEGGGICYE